MRNAILVILLVLIQNQASACLYPAEPINWILRYCALESGTDDEIVIQKSSCYKSAEKDLKDNNKCKISGKYKALVCEKVLKKESKYKDLKGCLHDPAVKPFFAGG